MSWHVGRRLQASKDETCQNFIQLMFIHTEKNETKFIAPKKLNFSFPMNTLIAKRAAIFYLLFGAQRGLCRSDSGGASGE